MMLQEFMESPAGLEIGATIVLSRSRFKAVLVSIAHEAVHQSLKVLGVGLSLSP